MPQGPQSRTVFAQHDALRADWRAFEPDKARIRSHVTADQMSMRGLRFAIPLASLMWLAGLLMVFPNLGH